MSITVNTTCMLCVYECVCVYVCLCVCVFACMCVCAAVIQPPKSQVALPGTVVNYVCHGDKGIELVVNLDKAREAGPELLNIGINFKYTSVGNVGVYNITINASVLNNGTDIYCLDDDGKSFIAYIYTVEGKSRHNARGC